LGQNKDHEQLAALDEFIEYGPIDEVIGTVKSGKEATVYACRHDDGYLIAAKVYRSRDVRGFANDAVYSHGRTRGMRRRDVLAIKTKSRAGREIAFGGWVKDEWDTLQLLHGAGCSVPEPLKRSDHVIIMEFIGDEGGAAPSLNNVRLEQSEAQRAFEEIVGDLELMLRCDRVHGDLSPYNVLYHDGRARIIDVPQAVDARFNANALPLLQRDVENVCNHFSRYGIDADARRICNQLWARYLRSEL
jgi:RIO kinase 1